MMSSRRSPRRLPRRMCDYGECGQPATHRVRFRPLPPLAADPPLSEAIPATPGYTVLACEWDAAEAREFSHSPARVYRFRRLPC